ncbi:hypothetical protein [Archangium sp.]|uniref:hypothetical protein n=1 Tax=Archangium sp. TaxID=1872627 RepID=UPI003899F574
MNPDLITSTLSQLHAVERYASTSEQHAALENSRLTLHFIMGRGDTGAFSDYLKNFNTHLPPVLSFATKEEADTWLRNHPAPPHGATIGAAGARYSLSYLRELDHRKLLRLPSEEEYARMEEAGEETEEEAAEEVLSPPHPSHGTRFSFFDFFNWTCFHLYEMEKRMSSPEELEAMRAAKIAFNFVMEVGEYHGFEEYRETVHSSRTSSPLQSFANQGEADAWLAKQPEPPPPEVVAIGNELYSVGYNRLRALRVLIRIPTPQELNTGAP